MRSQSPSLSAGFVLIVLLGASQWRPAIAKKPSKPGGGISLQAIELEPPVGVVPAGRVVPRDVNDQGHVVGQVEVFANVYQALYWNLDQSGTTPTSLGLDAIANGINEDDIIVGARLDESGNGVPVLWLGPSAAPIDLQLPDGHHQGEAVQINDSGLIVGWTSELVPDVDENGDRIDRQQTHAVAWQMSGLSNPLELSLPKILGALSPDKDNWTKGTTASEEILDGVFASTVIGTARNVDNFTRAVVWELISYTDSSGVIQIDVTSGPTEVGTLPGDTGSHGDAINRWGDAAGTPGFRKLNGQPLEELLPPSNINDPGFSYIRDINDEAEVVGEHWYGYGYAVPLVWLADGSAFDLNKSLGGTGWANVHSPMAINNAGTIVGFGLKYEGKGRNRRTVDAAFLLLKE